MHIFDVQGKKESIDSLLKNDPTIQYDALSNKTGKLSQGIRNVKGNDAIDYIPLSEVPRNKKVAYANMICDHRPLKTNKHRV